MKKHVSKANRPSPDQEAPQKESLAEFLFNSPLVGSGIEIKRQKDYPRKIDFSGDEFAGLDENK